MAQYGSLVITEKGQSLMTKTMVSGGDGLQFTKIATTETIYSDSALSKLVSLANIKQENKLSHIEVLNGSQIKIEAFVENSELTVGYSINTIGLYAIDPDDGEVLFAACRAIVPGYIPEYSGTAVSGASFEFVVSVTSTTNVNLEIDPAVVATIGDVVRHENKTPTSEGEAGVHGVRIYEGDIQVFNGAAWESLQTKFPVPVLQNFKNLLNPENISNVSRGKRTVFIDGLTPSSHYCMNFVPTLIMGNTSTGQEEVDFHASDNQAYIPGGNMQYTELVIYFDPDVDPTYFMFVEVPPEGPYITPTYFKPYGVENYINEELLHSVYVEIAKNGKDVTETMLSKCENLLDPSKINTDDALGKHISITSLEVGKKYVINTSSIEELSAIENGGFEPFDSEYYGNVNGGVWFTLKEGQEGVFIRFNDKIDESHLMLVKGSEIPPYFKPYGVSDYINDDLLASVYAEIDKVKVQTDAIALEDGNVVHLKGKDGCISRGKMTIDKAITFSPYVNGDFAQIIIQANVTASVPITWGTNKFLGAVKPTVGIGKYDFIFEYDGEDWCVGVIPKGAM